MNSESRVGGNSSGAGGRRKPRPREGAVERDLLNRLSRAEGQLRGLKKMIAERAYCIDLLQQISAVRRALDKTALILLRDHLETCVADALSAGGAASGADKINEVIDALDRFLA